MISCVELAGPRVATILAFRCRRIVLYGLVAVPWLRAVMRMARTANLRAIAISSVWTSPETSPDDAELARLRAAILAARTAGITPIVAIYSFGSSTPLTDAARGHFVAFLAAIIQDQVLIVGKHSVRFLRLSDGATLGSDW